MRAGLNCSPSPLGHLGDSVPIGHLAAGHILKDMGHKMPHIRKDPSREVVVMYMIKERTLKELWDVPR